jgi:hypothetical protein
MNEYETLVGILLIFGKKLLQCNSVHHKSHIDSPGIKPGSQGLEAGF